MRDPEPPLHIPHSFCLCQGVHSRGREEEGDNRGAVTHSRHMQSGPAILQGRGRREIGKGEVRGEAQGGARGRQEGYSGLQATIQAEAGPGASAWVRRGHPSGPHWQHAPGRPFDGSLRRATPRSLPLPLTPQARPKLASTYPPSSPYTVSCGLVSACHKERAEGLEVASVCGPGESSPAVLQRRGGEGRGGRGVVL